jgi:hypothetical protein
MNQQELNRMQRRYIKEPGIPLWVWLFVVFSVVIGATVVFRRYWALAKIERTAEKDKSAQEAERGKAVALAEEGYRQLVQERRNRLFARCRTDGNYPLLFIDKVVCVKPEAIAWVRYDGKPEVDGAE